MEPGEQEVEEGLVTVRELALAEHKALRRRVRLRCPEP